MYIYIYLYIYIHTHAHIFILQQIFQYLTKSLIYFCYCLRRSQLVTGESWSYKVRQLCLRIVVVNVSEIEAAITK